ncbi:copper radical oxidase [Sporormia fimetaria CBS 119925]|uniref:Copper radical oxidase n=1 Tax=Sporormia fimetaria CBS 119925 TaxID=1340428 RepID=A0A6A6VSV2_9PLEO|nr:copper radical oxidase [Sporormia fimetaria CBS 119925]
MVILSALFLLLFSGSGNAAGGEPRLLWPSALDTDGWHYLGCYTDRVATRTLNTQVFFHKDLTNAACLKACTDLGTIYAGTEYSGECFCGNQITYGAGPAPDGEAHCNMPCDGNKQEICGGPNRLTFFHYVNGTAPIPPSGTTLTYETQVITTRTSISGMQSYTRPTTSSTQSSTTPSTTQSSPSQTSTTQYTSTQTSTTQSSSIVSSTTQSASPTPSGIPAGWGYTGCWVDQVYGRILAFQQPDDPNLTVESCISRCSGLGFSIAGLQYSYQCFCDDFIRNAGQLAAQDSECSASCSGSPSQKCGAGNRNSIYTNNTELITYPVPIPQRNNLPGSWKYAGCLTEDYPNRLLDYQIILSKNNSATNCISQCSKFGFDAGGMEYGDECYCGDTRAVIAAGAAFAPEAECNFGCTGSPGTICGGPGRITYYTWQGASLNQWDYRTGADAGEYQFLIGGVVIPLITQVALNGKVTFLEKAGTGPPNTTGAYELDLAQINNFTGAWRPMHVKSDIFCATSLTLPDKAARQINVGGWANEATYGIRFYWPDGSPGVWGKNDWEEDYNKVALQNGRWYPSSMIMPNGSILVVGGEAGSNGAPVPTLEILPRVGPTVYCEWLKRTDPNNLYPFLVALPHGDIFVAYYNEAIILDEKTFEVKRQLPNMPGAVNNFLAGRTYPFEGSAVTLPQYPPYDELTILICGGTTPYQGVALDNCVSINPELPDAEWVIERMPSKRVLSCMTALPDGTFVIMNGATQGFAGFGLANFPNHNAVLYDPAKPLNNRFSVLANTTIDRMYHSESLLLDDGRVLVSGSDPQDNVHAQEYRVEVFIPPYLMGDPEQPVLNVSHTDWAYGQRVTFTTSMPLVKVSLMGAESQTHGATMGQRMFFPEQNCAGRRCTVVAPPNANVCPPGWLRLFGLTADGVPSKAVWVRVGGDPAELGNWPNAPGFSLPGV